MSVHLAPTRKQSKKAPRSWQFLVRFTQQEREMLDQLKGNSSYSAYVRQAALNRKSPSQTPVVNRETHKLLVKVSANLNQLTRTVHTLSKQGKTIAGLNSEVLLELQRAIAQVSADLIGSDSTEADEGDEMERVEVEL